MRINYLACLEWIPCITWQLVPVGAISCLQEFECSEYCFTVRSALIKKKKYALWRATLWVKFSYVIKKKRILAVVGFWFLWKPNTVYNIKLNIFPLLSFSFRFSPEPNGVLVCRIWAGILQIIFIIFTLIANLDLNFYFVIDS